MSACFRRVAIGITAPPTASHQRDYLQRAIWLLPDRRRWIVLRSAPEDRRRRCLIDVKGGAGEEPLRSGRGRGKEKTGRRAYAVGSLVEKGEGGDERDRTVEVLVAAGVTVVLGVGNRVLYKLALVPLKHHPFFLAQLATFGSIYFRWSVGGSGCCFWNGSWSISFWGSNSHFIPELFGLATSPVIYISWKEV